MNKEVKSVKEKKKRIFIGRLVLIFFVSAFITILGRGTADLVTAFLVPYADVIDSDWASFGSPYDIKREYFESHFLGGFRARWEEDGLDPNGLILKGLERWHKSAYERAIKKIPEDDLARTYFWLEYEFYPLQQRSMHRAVNTKSYVPTLVKTLEYLATGKSAVKRVDIKERFDFSNMLVDFLISEKWVAYWGQHRMWEKFAQLEKIEDMLLKGINVREQDFFDSDLLKLHGYARLPLVPFTTAYTAMRFYGEDIRHRRECTTYKKKNYARASALASHYHSKLMDFKFERDDIRELFLWKADKYHKIKAYMDPIILDYCPSNL